MKLQKHIDLLMDIGDASTIDRILHIYTTIILNTTKDTLQKDILYFTGILKTASNKRYKKMGIDLLSDKHTKNTNG